MLSLLVSDARLCHNGDPKAVGEYHRLSWLTTSLSCLKTPVSLLAFVLGVASNVLLRGHFA